MIAAILALAAVLQTGDQMPPLKGDYLSKREATLPDAAKGKIAFVALGFTYDSRKAVEAWVARYRRDFGTDSRTVFFEVPMIGGMGRMARWFIDSGMRNGTPKEQHENVITVYGGTGDWKDRVGFKDGSWAYVLVLDADGKIAALHGGPFTEQAYEPVAATIRQLLSKKI
jgi:hypothetical protein